MQNATSAHPKSAIGNESRRLVVANLMTLIEHLNARARVLELAILRETARSGMDMHGDIVVLDDITPCHLSANAALNACNAALAAALRVLLDHAHPTKVGTCGSTGTDCGAASLAVTA